MYTKRQNIYYLQSTIKITLIQSRIKNESNISLILKSSNRKTKNKPKCAKKRNNQIESYKKKIEFIEQS